MYVNTQTHTQALVCTQRRTSHVTYTAGIHSHTTTQSHTGHPGPRIQECKHHQRLIICEERESQSLEPRPTDASFPWFFQALFSLLSKDNLSNKPPNSVMAGLPLSILHYDDKFSQSWAHRANISLGPLAYYSLFKSIQ